MRRCGSGATLRASVGDTDVSSCLNFGRGGHIDRMAIRGFDTSCGGPTRARPWSFCRWIPAASRLGGEPAADYCKLIENALPVPGLCQLLLHTATRDPSKFKPTEEGLRQTKRRFRGTLENAAIDRARLNAEGRCLRANAKPANILGYAQGGSAGRIRAEVMSPGDQPDSRGRGCRAPVLRMSPGSWWLRGPKNWPPGDTTRGAYCHGIRATRSGPARVSRVLPTA
jgi:PAS domain-containing protein